MDLEKLRNMVCDFVEKAYVMVDDPSTDSIVSWGPDGTSFIVWKQLECKRDLLTKHFQMYTFSNFYAYGFRKIVPGQGELEFACNDFVRGKPELLGKIADVVVEHMRASNARFEPTRQLLSKCKNREERDLVFKQASDRRKKERKERLEAAQLARAIERLRAKRLEDQMHHVQI